MIDYENEDLNKFDTAMVKNYLSKVEKFNGKSGKQKMVDWCVNKRLYDLLARIAMVDYRHC